MNAPRRTRALQRISMVSMPLTARERDQQALQWLTTAATRGSPVGMQWPITFEPWDAIWQRFEANDYPRDKRRSLWMHRHFHVRRSYHDETPKDSAAYVARLWNSRAAHVETVRTAASRKAVSGPAKKWIEEAKQQLQRPMPGINAPKPPTDRQVYELIDFGLKAIAEEFSRKT